MTVQHLIGDPFTPTGKLKPSYNSARSGLQGSRDPPTGKEAHSGRPLSPVSRKKSRVSRPRSSGKPFHFPRRTFSRSPTGCPSRRFAASADPESVTAGFGVRDRRVEAPRPQPPLFATADLFSAAALTFSAAALTFSAAAAPTLCVRSTLKPAPTADLIRPFRRRNPPRPVAQLYHHSPTRLRPLPDLPLTTAKSGGCHSPTLAS